MPKSMSVTIRKYQLLCVSVKDTVDADGSHGFASTTDAVGRFDQVGHQHKSARKSGRF